MIPAAILGAVCGTLSGLVPGFHINAVTAIGGAALIGFGPAAIPAIVAMTVAHAVVEVVPVLLLGAPADDAYALQPGHRLVARLGVRPVLALCLTTTWLTLAGTVLVAVALLMLDVPLLSRIQDLARPWMGWLLTAIAVWLIGRERFWPAAAGIYLASGLLGLLVLDTGLAPNTPEAPFTGILPALAGLFGLSGAAAVIAAPPAGPDAADRHPASAAVAGGDVATGLAGGILAGFLPGLGAANLATMTSAWRPLTDDRRYLVVTTAINTGNLVFAFVMWSLADRIRSGPAAVLGLLGGHGDPARLPAMLASALIGATVGTATLLLGAATIAKLLGRTQPAAMALGVAAAVTYLVAATTGLAGCLILTVGLIIGLAAIRTGVARSHGMGFFLLPVTLYYLGWQDAVCTGLGITRQTMAGPDWGLTSLTVLVTAMAAAGWLGYQGGTTRWLGDKSRDLAFHLWPPRPEPVPSTLPEEEDEEAWGDWTSWQ